MLKFLAQIIPDECLMAKLDTWVISQQSDRDTGELRQIDRDHVTTTPVTLYQMNRTICRMSHMTHQMRQ